MQPIRLALLLSILASLSSTEVVAQRRTAHSGIGLATPSFVPNKGQWERDVCFSLFGGPIAAVLERGGWRLDLPDREHLGRRRGTVLRMSFRRADGSPRGEWVGEHVLPGRLNFFVGDDSSRWRTTVPRYASALWSNVYSGIDVRFRHGVEHPEYDLIVRPGADLGEVVLEIDGADNLRLTRDGELWVRTRFGVLKQPLPSTWVLREGRRESVQCRFVRKGASSFGFAVDAWDGRTDLLIDPPLIWSTLLGGSQSWGAESMESIHVGDDGFVTVAGVSGAPDFPTTTGSYDTTFNQFQDAIIARLDPRATGAAQLVWGTFYGGDLGNDLVTDMAVHPSGVVAIVGHTDSGDLPTTPGALIRVFDGPSDAFVALFDPSRNGPAQLLYGSFVGGSGFESARAVDLGPGNTMVIAGTTSSDDFPVTAGAFDPKGPSVVDTDAFVAHLDPSKSGAAQLLYATYLGVHGNNSRDGASDVHIDDAGVITVTGTTENAAFPTTTTALPLANSIMGFVTRLDPGLAGPNQLVYSLLFDGAEECRSLTVAGSGDVTVTGSAMPGLPTTTNALNGNWQSGAFVLRLDPSASGASQVRYASYVGGSLGARILAHVEDSRGVITMVGTTRSSDFPTTPNAYAMTHGSGGNGLDAFVTRLDPALAATSQVVYSTFLGGIGDDIALAVATDASGTAYVAGRTGAAFPTTAGAIKSTPTGVDDGFVARLDMGVVMYADRHALPLTPGGVQVLEFDAGSSNAGRLYWVFGSMSGTSPGVQLGGIPILLNPDLYTDFTIVWANSTFLQTTRGTLDSNGRGRASIHVASGLAAALDLHHAVVVYAAAGNIFLASNPVPLALTN